MSGHTPGPWKAAFIRDGGGGEWEIGTRTHLVARVCLTTEGNDDPIHAANAALIAAAPDLLALAEKVAAHFADTDAPLGIEARALLAKAGAP